MALKEKITRAIKAFTGPALTRGYKEVTGIGNANSDWPFSSLTEDSDVWQNAWALTSRCRDLMRCNPLYVKYRELLFANIFGEKGIMLRMKVKETEDRVISSPDEKSALRAHENRINRIREWAERQTGNKIEAYRAFHLADGLDRSKPEDVLRGRSMIKVGAPDVYANMRIESAWQEWQRPEFCDMRKRRDYNVLRQLRLISAVRDGDFFIRKVKNPRVNKFGFTLQLINAEWCDRFYNTILPNGNVVIMGIEYKMTPWGIGEPVNFFMIRRQPQDWQFSIPGAFNFAAGTLHIPVPADEIIHYARPVDADSTRPAPWIASTIPSGRQLDQYSLAEVIAAREQACKVGFLYSDVLPEGGGAVTDPKKSLPKHSLAPGDIWALDYGVKYQERDPKHPNGNFPGFRKEIVRMMAAGMPGADYNTLANDLENINFSAGRLGRLDTNAMSMMIQSFDVQTAERPIFEDFLEMSLITGAIPLPLAKLGKFNKPVFSPKRWRQVDEVKEVTGAAMRIANKLSTRNQECADMGSDFEEVVMELAEEEMLLSELGLDSKTTVETPGVASQIASEKPDNDDDIKPAPKDGKNPKKE